MTPKQLVAKLQKLRDQLEDDEDYAFVADDLGVLIYGIRKKFRMLDADEQWRADNMDRLADFCFAAAQQAVIKSDWNLLATIEQKYGAPLGGLYRMYAQQEASTPAAPATSAEPHTEPAE